MPQTIYEKVSKEVARQLKQFRKSRKMTEAQMAKVLRISEDRWRKFESGVADPRSHLAITQIGKLAKHFSIDQRELELFLVGENRNAAIPA
jgi:DNA-binding XRE family transcriptional regulator